MNRLPLPKLVISGKRNRPTKTLPDQAISVAEIFRRFAKGLPSMEAVRTPVYLDQNEYDFEKLSRLPFDEKHALAEQMRQKAEDIKADLELLAKAESEANARKQEEARQAQKKAAEGPKKAPGIVPLDNTMPGDTNQ